MIRNWLYPVGIFNMAIPPTLEVVDAEEHGLVDEEGRVDWITVRDLVAEKREAYMGLRCVELGFVVVERPIQENRTMVFSMATTETYDAAIAAAKRAYAWDADTNKATLDPMIRYVEMCLDKDRLHISNYEQIEKYIALWMAETPNDPRVIQANIDFTMSRLSRTLSKSGEFYELD